MLVLILGLCRSPLSVGSFCQIEVPNPYVHHRCDVTPPLILTRSFRNFELKGEGCSLKTECRPLLFFLVFLFIGQF